MTSIFNYNSGIIGSTGGEMTPAIKVHNASDFTHARTIYRVGVNLQPNDTVIFMGEVEFTNDLGYLVSVVSGIVLAEQWHHVPPNVIAELTEFNGPNFDSTMIHHQVINKAGTYVVPPHISGNYCINWVSFACSQFAKADDWLTVGQDYGRLNVIVLRNNETVL